MIKEKKKMRMAFYNYQQIEKFEANKSIFFLVIRQPCLWNENINKTTTCDSEWDSKYIYLFSATTEYIYDFIPKTM